MPYLNEADLSRYDPKLKEWISAQPVKTLPSTLYPWTLTAKAGAVTCWPVGGTELKPTVDFLFSETGPASGDKGPDNPSTIFDMVFSFYISDAAGPPSAGGRIRSHSSSGSSRSRSPRKR